MPWRKRCRSARRFPDRSGRLHRSRRLDDFPTTAGAYDITYDINPDPTVWIPEGEAFISRLGSDASHLPHSTSLGGAFSDDRVYGVALKEAGIAYVGGGTECPDFPTTVGAFQETTPTYAWNGNDYVWRGILAEMNRGNSQPGQDVVLEPDPDATWTFDQVDEAGETTITYSQSAPPIAPSRGTRWGAVSLAAWAPRAHVV